MADEEQNQLKPTIAGAAAEGTGTGPEVRGLWHFLLWHIMQRRARGFAAAAGGRGTM